uniref:Uncharacterized protein n=1 Tax=viral metagenome TaxID=1070528 RepID=A0A6C0EIY9_9ZZZZ
MLNINSLNNIRDQKEINKYEIYKKVLSKCHHRIKVVSQKGDSFCFYVIPEYIFGVPKYDKLCCAEYIINKLKQNGFRLTYTFPNLLFICWGHISSEISKPKTISTDLKESRTSKTKETSSEFRYKEDYKSSNNFLKKII